MPPDRPSTVLHYVGYDVDRGGILAVIRALAAEHRFGCVLGVNPVFEAGRSRALPLLRLPAIAGEHIGVGSLWRAYRVARDARTWLRADPTRVFHGHSRAGLLVALRLRARGETRVAATVHCLGRQRWFYRRAARTLAGRIFWLSPAMKAYYGVDTPGEADCLPPCIPRAGWREGPSARRDGVFQIGCIGSLVPVKQWELVPAALVLVSRDLPLRVVHAGGEDGTAASAAYAARLRTLASSPAVGGRFELRGEVTDVPGLLDTLDGVLISGAREAFSVAALEAGAAGVPCLAADGPGNRALIEQARLGWTFAADSASALAARLSELVTSGELRAWRRDDHALEAFAAPAVAARYEAVYRRLVSA
ncbi:glycosyltransferase [Horticoccus sp. 23ND18S-11]|uniref:glycosyltransferase n=1 Tax=Horticoccus sp. 23ND18S-11 TaxID=3391832 RepID=UPI0039C96D2E